MAKKHFFMFWFCCVLIVAISGCDSTTNIDSSNLQLTIASDPSTVLTGEFSLITATLKNADTSVATGTSTTTTAPVIGYPVSFAITQNASNCSIVIVNGLTDASGNAMAIYQAGSIAGIDIVQASIDDGQSASASIIVNLSPTPTPTPTPTP